jgi:hypothetical protein
MMNGAVAEGASWTQQYYLTVTSPYGSPTPVSGWFNAGTAIQASVSSPVTTSIIAQYVCTGWAGAGSAPATGTTTSTSFIIDQPSSIVWDWKTEYSITSLLVITIIILAASIGLAVYLLLRGRHKGKSTEGAFEPTLPPAAAQKPVTPISIMRWLLLLFQRETAGAHFSAYYSCL